MKMSMKKFLLLPLWALMISLCMLSCSKDEGKDIPEPPTPGPDPVPTRTIHVTAQIDALDDDSLFVGFRHWQKPELLKLFVVPQRKGGGLFTKSSYYPRPNLNGSLFQMTSTGDSALATTATFVGNIREGADSLVAFCLYSEILQNGNRAPFDLLVGGCEISEDDSTYTFTMNHQTSQIGLKMVNKTGNDLIVQSVRMEMVDNSAPFYQNGLSFVYQTGEMALSTGLSLGMMIKQDTTAVVNLPILLAAESDLKDKAIRYLIKTDKGMYIYTKTGKEYLRGNRYEEEFSLEGK